MILGERLGMTVNDLLIKMSSLEISEYMAFDNLKEEKYRDKLKSEMMTEEERNKSIKALLGFK